ncbi:MAG: two component transcriptional regulator, winged helix family [Nocardioidaceae bacterium]|nr:two component transcriptional regulator, winged helix family [Nocardioidaceae bacterium]
MSGPPTASASYRLPVSETGTAVVIEDDPDIRDLVALVLRGTGLRVEVASDATIGIALVEQHAPVVVTLDLSLPDIDGLEVCRRLRKFTDAYLLMLTARSTEMDLLLGLETGADDYLVKPFSPRELAARVNALLRRPRALAGAAGTPDGSTGPGGGPLVHVDLSIDPGRRTVHRGGVELDLTKTEYDLLLALVMAPDRVWSKSALLAEVWNDTWSADGHLVETHMGNLRRKLGDDPKEGRYVRTVRGVGYRLGSG